jgi:hypothetical protein
MKVMLGRYGGITDSYEAHSGFCVGDDVFYKLIQVFSTPNARSIWVLLDTLCNDAGFLC